MVRLPQKDRIKIEEFVFGEAGKYNASSDIEKLEKLSGYSHYYKIRFGNYRVGVKLIDEELVFERVLHRKKSISISLKSSVQSYHLRNLPNPCNPLNL
ncbi:hypothetical protein FW774_15895 [Pedobacter sp. BS3]|nr:hypothetical protein FW774_15895 [Pedobacter sp. BS3]